MIYDCFTFFNENDVLELKINIEKDYVDKFVIVEAPITFAGKKKDLCFDKERFAKYADKILYYAIKDFPKFDSPWLNEDYQRNYIFEVLKQNNCQNDDVIIVTDVDEIISEKVVKEYKSGIMSIQQNNYYYYINNMQLHTKWYASKILHFSDFFRKPENCLEFYMHKRILSYNSTSHYTPNEIRLAENCEIIKSGGWHFSFMGGEEAIINKIKAYSHQEYNNDKVLNLTHIRKQINAGKDILGRKNFKFCPQALDNTLPKYILLNQQALSKYIFHIPPQKHFYYLCKKFKASILDFLYSKERNGLYRIIKICGITIKYKKRYS